jgi:hypothetical protein
LSVVTQLRGEVVLRFPDDAAAGRLGLSDSPFH